MKLQKLVLGFVLQATLAAMVAGFAFADPHTFTGVVTDDMCGKKHTMMPGKPDSECIRACVKSGSKYALLVGDKLYALNGDVKLIDNLAGKKVKVTGDVSGTTITLASISAAK
jgi:hypothetical protein